MDMEAAVISSFADYGLAGIVILSLLYMMYKVGRWFSIHLEKLSELHQTERGQWQDMVREISTVQDHRQKETNTILTELKTVIAGKMYAAEDSSCALSERCEDFINTEGGRSQRRAGFKKKGS